MLIDKKRKRILLVMSPKSVAKYVSFFQNKNIKVSPVLYQLTGTSSCNIRISRAKISVLDPVRNPNQSDNFQQNPIGSCWMSDPTISDSRI